MDNDAKMRHGIKRKITNAKGDYVRGKSRKEWRGRKERRAVSYDRKSRKDWGNARRVIHSFSQQKPWIDRRMLIGKQMKKSDPRMVMITDFVKQTQLYIQKLYWNYKNKFQLDSNTDDRYEALEYNDNNNGIDMMDIEDDTTQADSTSFPITNLQSLLSTNLFNILLSPQENIEQYYKQKSLCNSYTSLSFESHNQFELLSNHPKSPSQLFQPSIGNSYQITPDEAMLIKINELIQERLSKITATKGIIENEIMIKDKEINSMEKEYDSSAKVINERKEEITCGINTIKTMYQYIKDLRSNINVYCRVKPSIINDKIITYPEYTEGSPSNNNNMHVIEVKASPSCSHNENTYHSFDNIFMEDHDQHFLFNRLKESFGKILEGEQLAFLLIGQTNSGKSYTLKGTSNPNDEGLIQRLYTHCTQVSLKQSYDIKLSLSIIAIVNDTPYEIFQEKKGDQFYKHKPLPNNQFHTDKWTQIPSKDILSRHLSYIDQGELLKGREHEAHICYQLKIEHNNKRHSDSYVSFIKTTGSECLMYQNAHDGYYNTKAMKTIGKVISMLIDKKANKTLIPYKDSKITQILKNVFKSCNKIMVLLTMINDTTAIEETRELMRFSHSSMLSF